MNEVLGCQHPDRDSGQCEGTCGKTDIIGYLIFTIFLCISNFILLNLVMAVLMQELQSAIHASQRKSSPGLSMLMNVSAATSKWIKIAEGGGNGTATDESKSEASVGTPVPTGSPGSPVASNRGGGSSPLGRR